MPAEFEGRDFHAEVVIPGKTELPVYVRSLKPGTYHFFNDFHPEQQRHADREEGGAVKSLDAGAHPSQRAFGRAQ